MRFALSLSCAAVFGFAAAPAALAQTAPALPVMPMPVAVATTAPALSAAESAAPAAAIAPADANFSSSLPDAPSANEGEDALLDGQAGNGGAPSPGPVASKYTTTILPGQAALPLSGKDKVAFAFRGAVSPFSFAAIVISATYSQGVDSQPHYGQGWGPYGQRIGAAAARSTVQTLATEAIFDPLFHDDPRYYVLGRQHNFFGRVVYAATRVVVTRGDNGHNRLNAPLLLGYAAAAGTNFAYYPQRDRNFGDAATGYAGSLGGAVLGMEVNEFINDALHLVHLRK